MEQKRESLKNLDDKSSCQSANGTIFSTLLRCLDTDAPLPSSEELTKAVDDLKLLYISSSKAGSHFETLPSNVVVVLLHMYSDIKNTASYCQGTLKDIICGYFENVKTNSAFSVIRNWILDERQTGTIHRRRKVVFIPGSTGGVAVVEKIGRSEETMDNSDRVELLSEIILTLSVDKQRKLLDQTLKTLLQNESTSADLPTSSSKTLHDSMDNYGMLSFLSFAVALLDQNPDLGNSSRKNVAKLCQILLKKNSTIDDTVDDELKSLKTQNLQLTLGIIGGLFIDPNLSEDVKEEVQKLQATLGSLSENHFDEDVRTNARDLHFFMAALTKSELPSISSSTSVKSTAKAESSGQHSKYDEAISDIDDPLLPVRAHALVVLAKLIKTKDHKACSNIDVLIPKFIERLEEEDSYVYLAAINCLAAAGLYRPNVVLPILMEVFMNSDDDGANGLDRRLKIGEAIVKISREMGDLAPFYGNQMISIFFSLMRKGDDETKASCLANLAEVCRLLSFKLNSYISELLYCGEQMLRYEKSQLVRRGAINLLVSLSENGESFLEVLDNQSREFYRFVKDVYENDKDDVVRIHAEKCLQNLGDHAKTLLKPLIVPLS